MKRLQMVAFVFAGYTAITFFILFVLWWTNILHITVQIKL
jgi:hypothetical protein